MHHVADDIILLHRYLDRLRVEDIEVGLELVLQS